MIEKKFINNIEREVLIFFKYNFLRVSKHTPYNKTKNTSFRTR